MPESPPASPGTAQPSVYPTKNKSSETAEITGKLRKNRFGLESESCGWMLGVARLTSEKTGVGYHPLGLPS
jgi:hypothetical protein